MVTGSTLYVVESGSLVLATEINSPSDGSGVRVRRSGVYSINISAEIQWPSLKTALFDPHSATEIAKLVDVVSGVDDQYSPKGLNQSVETADGGVLNLGRQELFGDHLALLMVYNVSSGTSTDTIAFVVTSDTYMEKFETTIRS
jgi:hypothetical protein